MARRRWVRSVLERAVVCVALGGMTTVGAAWALAVFLPHRGLSRRFNVVQATDAAGKLRYVTAVEFSRAGMVRRMWQPGVGGPVWPAGREELEKESTLLMRPRVEQDRSWGDLPRALASDSAPGSGMEDARGWPLPALWCSLDSAGIDARTTTTPVRGGFRVSGNAAGSGQFRALPLRPVWRGAVVDTAVFAAAWAVAIGLFVAVRAMVRRRRGLCPRCAYSLRGSAGVCPECGRNRPAAAPVGG